MDNLLIKCRDSLESINKYSDAAKEQVKKLVMEDGVVSKGLMAREQHAAHSLAWIATYKATLTELLNWAERLESENKFLETEKLIFCPVPIVLTPITEPSTDTKGPPELPGLMAAFV